MGCSFPIQCSVDEAQRLGPSYLCPDDLAASNIGANVAMASRANKPMFPWLLPFESDFLLFDDSSSANGLSSPPMTIVSRASDLDHVDYERFLQYKTLGTAGGPEAGRAT